MTRNSSLGRAYFRRYYFFKTDQRFSTISLKWIIGISSIITLAQIIHQKDLYQFLNRYFHAQDFPNFRQRLCISAIWSIQTSHELNSINSFFEERSIWVNKCYYRCNIRRLIISFLFFFSIMQICFFFPNLVIYFSNTSSSNWEYFIFTIWQNIFSAYWFNGYIHNISKKSASQSLWQSESL